MFKEKEIIDNLPAMVQNWANRGFVFDQAQFLALHNEKKTVQVELEGLLAQKNKASRFNGKPTLEMLEAVKLEAVARGEKADKLQKEFDRLHLQMETILLNLPNQTNGVKTGGEEDNEEIYCWGHIADNTEKGFDVLAHDELTEELDLEAGAMLAKSRFSVLKGDIALLHRALINFMLDTHIEAGYELLYVPYLVNAKTMQGTGQLPKFKDDLFHLAEDDLYLIPTAEVPVTNLFQGKLLLDEVVDYKYVCHTPCFRREAGSAGRDTRGIIRQHQFEKIEIVRLCEPDKSYEILEELTLQAEKVLQLLELPYRKIQLASRDLGFSAARTYDLEVWMPAQGKYREISSISNFEDFQTTRMQARVKRDGKTFYPHTLNGSGVAVGRCLAAIMENCQTMQKTIEVPKVLQKYLGKTELLIQGGAKLDKHSTQDNGGQKVKLK